MRRPSLPSITVYFPAYDEEFVVLNSADRQWNGPVGVYRQSSW